jgi:thioredoxin domain-containing protein 5
VALKDHDIQTPSSVLHEHISSEKKLNTWLLSHRLSTTVELTQDTFQQVMNAPQEPLVVIAAVTKANKDKVKERFRDIGKKWRFKTEGSGIIYGRDVVFSWMDVERWSDWMKSMYGISKGGDGDGNLDDVRVIIADHKVCIVDDIITSLAYADRTMNTQRLIYYDKDPSDSRIKLTSTSLFPTIEAAATGQISFKHSENFIERMARVRPFQTFVTIQPFLIVTKQYLNTKMTSIEQFVVTYPLRATFIVLLVVVLIIWGLKRLIADDIPTDRDYRAAKADRLD